MQLSRGTVKAGCFSSLMQKQGKKTFIIKTERLSAVLSREGRTKRKHHSGLQTQERLLQRQKESFILWPLCNEQKQLYQITQSGNLG